MRIFSWPILAMGFAHKDESQVAARPDDAGLRQICWLTEPESG